MMVPEYLPEGRGATRMPSKRIQTKSGISGNYLDGRSWLYVLEDVISVGN